MKIRLVLALGAASFLSACTDADWQRGMAFVGFGGAENAAPAPRPVARTTPRLAAPRPAAPAQTAQANGVNPFCAAVARQDSDGHGFDATTQQGVFVRSYQQCVVIFGNNAEQ